MEEIKKKTIDKLKLSERAINALNRKGFYKIEDLTLVVSERIYNIRNIGEKTAKEIIDAVHKNGLTFLEEREEENSLEKTIYNLGLSTRLKHVLQNHGCIRIKDICSLSIRQLNDFFGMGDELKKELINKIHELGYYFYDEELTLKEENVSLEELYIEREKLLKNKENLQKTLRYVERKLENVGLKIAEINSKNR